MNQNKQGLINHLIKSGKTDKFSWDDLATKFNLGNGEAARAIWKNYRRVNNILSNASDSQLEDFEQKINREKGTGEVSFFSTKTALTDHQIYIECKMDPNTWVLTQVWQKKRATGFTYSANFKLIKAESKAKTDFFDVLKNFKTDHKVVKNQVSTNLDKYNSCLILNKQDAHLNKYDDDGKNNIFSRFSVIKDKTKRILDKVNISSNLDKVVYVLGSDEFNSEWMNTTTKGTPQQNIMDYHESFTAICYHEIDIINLLLTYSNNIEVIYIAGNHDEFVGWHLLSWLKVYYKEQKNISFDISPNYTKYIKYSDSAICFNHGDAMSPETLARNFPIEFKKEWSSCNNYYIFTGDKHTDLSRNIGGIQFYRIPALDKSNSKWDKKNGYTIGKTEITSFLIGKNQGITDIYKEQI